MCRPERRSHFQSQLIFTQNCRGAKTADRMTMLIDGLKSEGGFAAFAQETWRAGDERLVQDGCCFLGIGPDKQTGRGSLGLGILLSAAAYDAWQRSGAEVHVDLGMRVMAARLEAQVGRQRRGVFLLNGYAPVSTAPVGEWDAYYDSLSRGLARMRCGDLLISLESMRTPVLAAAACV